MVKDRYQQETGRWERERDLGTSSLPPTLPRPSALPQSSWRRLPLCAALKPQSPQPPGPVLQLVSTYALLQASACCPWSQRYPFVLPTPPGVIHHACSSECASGPAGPLTGTTLSRPCQRRVVPLRAPEVKALAEGHH